MDTILWTRESDAYTKRATFALNRDNIYDKNKILFAKEFKQITSNFIPNPSKILDIGCSYGAAIYYLKDIFKNVEFEGLDPGIESIKIAKDNFQKHSNINFQNGHSHKLPYDDESFDIIILSMVLQWVPRKYLIKTLSEINRVLKTGGGCYIVEFLPNKPITSLSTHNNSVYIFKENYTELFTAFKWYKEVYRTVKDIEFGEDFQRVVSFIQKYEIEDIYTLKEGKTENEKNKNRK